MKALLIATLFAVPAFANERPYEFEVEPSCIWNKSHGRCVVQNKFNHPIHCIVETAGKTFKGLSVGNTRRIEVLPQKFNDSARVFVAEGDVLTHLSAHADCQAS